MFGHWLSVREPGSWYSCLDQNLHHESDSLTGQGVEHDPRPLNYRWQSSNQRDTLSQMLQCNVMFQRLFTSDWYTPRRTNNEHATIISFPLLHSTISILSLSGCSRSVWFSCNVTSECRVNCDTRTPPPPSFQYRSIPRKR